MAGDDILWKNVEALKTQPASASEDAPTRTATGQKRKQRSAKVSPSTREVGSDDSSPSPSSQDTNGIRLMSPMAQSGQLTNAPTAMQPTVRTDGRAYGQVMQIPGRPDLRRPERYAFQFWTDQITRLKKLRQFLNMAKDPEDRTEVTLSDLAREALDEYLDRQTQSNEQIVHPAD